jgi:hypothetical protein
MGIHFDPEFLKFMQRHDKVQTEAGSSFSYGRPINEVLTALQKLTGETGIVPGEKDNQEFKDIRQVFRDWPEGRPEENRKKPTLFLRFAEHWADWWSKNWRSFVKDEAEAQLDQTKQTLERLSRRT